MTISNVKAFIINILTSNISIEKAKNGSNKLAYYPASFKIIAAVKINSIKNKKERGVRQLGELRLGLHKRAFLFLCCLVERVLERARARE